MNILSNTTNALVKNRALEVMISKRNMIILEEGNNLEYDQALVYVTTILKNLENLGYTLSEELIDILVTLEISELTSFYQELTTILKNSLGEKGFINVMYPNFPTEVMEKSEVELYLNAIIHYLSEGKLLPDIEKEERFPLIDNKKLKVLELGTNEDLFSIFTNLVGAKGSISASDKDLLTWFTQTYKEKLTNHMPEEIHNKEVLSFVTGLMMSIKNIDITKVLLPYFKTATDVLRLAVSMSNGDVSLSEPTKFKSFKRSERRLILALLENVNNIEEDMVRHSSMWIRLGERVHPSEYRQYQKANLAFFKIRNNIKIETFNSKLENAFITSNIKSVIKLLSKRPGEFARRLDQTLRMATDINEEKMVAKAFELVAKEVSTPVLLQTRAYFIDRAKHNKKDMRVFSPKGNMTKLYGIDNNLKTVDKAVCREIVQVCSNALKDSFKEKGPLLNVYVDEEMKNMVVPTSQRSASKSLRTLVRGSKFLIDKQTKVLRPFIYWREDEKTNRVDLDLSVVLYDKDFRRKESISWRNLRSEEYGCVHSGDITSAPNGAHEFIDMDLSLLREKGIKYITLALQSYSYQNFSELPECFIGVMERENALTGEIFEPKTVKIKADVSNGVDMNIPMMIDIEEDLIVWTDLVAESYGFDNSVLTNAKTLELNTKAMFNLIKPNLYDLFVLHARARGSLVKTIEDADIICSLDGDLSPYDVDVIMADFI